VGAELEANLDRYDRSYPGRFATFCHVDWAALANGEPERLPASFADPVAFSDPVDERNERLEELLEHPEWSFADTAFPRFG
jgi:hypothetical protein